MSWTRNALRSSRALTSALALLVLSPAGAVPSEEPAPPSPAPGDVVPAFDATGIDGRSQHVAYSKGTTVLVFFLSSCPTCHRMIPLWNRAFQHKPAGLQVVGVLMDQEPPNFFATTAISFPVVRSPGKEFLQKWKVSRAPLMVRVAPGGKVEDVSMGYADAIRVGEVFKP